MRYAIHPKLEVIISTQSKRYEAYFENEYKKVSGFQLSGDHTTINVHIVHELPPRQDGDRTRTLKFKKFFAYEYLIRNLDGKTVSIYFKDNTIGRVYAKCITLFLQAQVLEPIIYLKLLHHNILFMHAAGVSDGTHSYLFPAYGGTGKTTLTLGLMGEGMHVLGDDLLIVDPGSGTVHPYLRPLHIFSYNVQTLRDATLPLLLRAKIKTKDLLRVILEALTREEFLISTRVHADSIYADFRAGQAAPYRKVVFLKKTGAHEKVRLTNDNLRELANEVLKSSDLNESLYRNILTPDEKESVVNQELEVIGNVLRNVPCLEFVNTRLLDFRNLSEFMNDLTQPVA